MQTHRAFADAIGVEPRALWRYESENVEPSASILSRIATVSGVELKWLIDGDPQTESAPAEIVTEPAA